MKFSKLIDNLNGLKLRGIGQNFNGKVSNDAPLATLIGCVTDYATNMKQNLPLYDSIACALTSCDSIANWYAKYQVDHPLNIPNVNSDIVIDIEEDEGDAIISGFTDAQKSLDRGNFVTVTSTSGLAYSVTVIDEKLYCCNVYDKLVPVCWRSGEGYKLRLNWPSTSSDFEAEGTISQKDTINRNCDIICSVGENLPIDGNLFTRLKRAALKVNSEAEIATVADAIEVLNESHSVEDGTISGSLSEISDQVTPNPEVVVNASDSVLVITQGVAESSTMNEVVCDSVDALRNNTISGYLDVAQGKYAKRGAVKTFVAKLINSYKTGGIRGFLLFIIRLIKAQGSITDKDGVMRFTDNAALVPKEFIVGVIATVIGAVISVVGAILAIVTPIIGILISTVGAMAWSVFGSAKSAYNDTFSRFEEFVTEQEELSALPYSPVALFRGTSSISNKLFSWYKDFYDTHQTCTYVQVPGGVLFVGPGSFADNGSLSTIRLEFHPFTLPINNFGWVKFQALFTNVDDYTGKKRIHASWRDPKYVYGAWYRIMQDSDCYSVPSNDEDGHLSKDDDLAVQGSVIACCGVFLYWMTLTIGYVPWLATSEYTLMGPYYAESESGIIDSCHNFNSKHGAGWCIQALGALANLFTVPEELTSWAKSNLYLGNLAGNILDWSNLIKFADAVSSGTVHLSTSVSYEDGHWYQFDYVDAHADLRELKAVCRQLVDGTTAPPEGSMHWNIGIPRPLPERPKYTIIPPSMNKTTFWMWAALGIAITTVAVTGAVIGSIKFNKWRRTRQLMNAERANNARAEYSNAIAGRREVYNPETHQYDTYEFDVNSPEGQNYINSVTKEYKSICLKNNMMANIIGGTRYDYSSFYGDKDESSDDESESPADKLKSVLFANDEDDIIDVEGVDNYQPNLADVIKLINHNYFNPQES